MKRALIASAILTVCTVTDRLLAAPVAEVHDDVARGEQVYRKWCVSCHGSGPGHPGTMALAVRYEGMGIPAPLAERKNLSPQIVGLFVRNGISIMPFFRKTEISDQDLAALGAYLSRNSPKR